MPNLSPDDPKIQNHIEAKLNLWYGSLNKIFGMVGVGLGFAALSTKSPQFYGTLVLLFVLILWAKEAKKIFPLLKLLNSENHSGISPSSIIIRGAEYVFGLTFLLLIVFGCLTTETSFKSIGSFITKMF